MLLILVEEQSRFMNRLMNRKSKKEKKGIWVSETGKTGVYQKLKIKSERERKRGFPT